MHIGPLMRATYAGGNDVDVNWFTRYGYLALPFNLKPLCLTENFFQTVTGSEKMLARYDGTIEGDASSEKMSLGAVPGPT
jgi:hypothetical protein